MKNVNNLRIAKVQPEGVAQHMLDFSAKKRVKGASTKLYFQGILTREVFKINFTEHICFGCIFVLWVNAKYVCSQLIFVDVYCQVNMC